jgi:hypothetical protein
VTSVLLSEYRAHRDQGHGHHAALLALARRFDLDKATVERAVEKAQKTEYASRPPADQGGGSNFSNGAPRSPRQSLARASAQRASFWRTFPDVGKTSTGD